MLILEVGCWIALSCSYHRNDFTPLNIHPSIHVSTLRLLKASILICQSVVIALRAGWLGIFSSTPPQIRHTCIYVCVCSLVDISNTSSDAHERTHSIARLQKTRPTHVVVHKRCLFTKAPTLRRCHLTADLSLLNMKNTITQWHRYLSPRAPRDLSFFSQRCMITAADLKLHERDWSKGQRDGKQK